MKYFPLILLGVLLNATAQILLKRGMSEFGHLSMKWEDVSPALPKMITNIPIIVALFCYGVSVLVWMGVLSKVDVSLAYPMLSIGYIVVLTYGYFWGQEQVNWERIVGVALICVGIVFLFRSAQPSH